MDRFLRILLALLVAIGATGTELRLPEKPAEMDCGEACPCGMPMPQRGPQPCGTSVPTPIAAPTRTVAAIVDYATASDRIAREPRPWPAAWDVPPQLHNEGRVASRFMPVDTGPPLLASERAAQLRVFRI